MTATELAKALGGSFNGKWINIPGPGHGCGDTSLGFCFEPNQPSGIRIHSFAGDDPAICRPHVINRLYSLSGGALPVIEQKAHPALDQADTATTTKALSVGMRRWAWPTPPLKIISPPVAACQPPQFP
jgi:hypothetical protein